MTDEGESDLRKSLNAEESIIAERLEDSIISGRDAIQNVYNFSGVPLEKYDDARDTIYQLKAQLEKISTEKIVDLFSAKDIDTRPNEHAKKVMTTFESLIEMGAAVGDPDLLLRISSTAKMAMQLDRSLELAEMALEKFEENENKWGIARTNLQISKLISSPDKKIELLETAFSDFDEIDDGTGKALCSLSLSQYSDDIPGKLELINRAIEISSNIGDDVLTGQCFLFLARFEWRHGGTKKALQAYEKSIKSSLSGNSRSNASGTMVELGRFKRGLGDYEGAELLIKRALMISKEIHDRREEHECYHHLAHLASDLGDSAASDKYHNKSLEIAVKLNDPDLQSSILTCIGVDYMQRDLNTQARESLDRALELSKSAGNRNREAIVLHRLGHLHHKMLDMEEADRHHIASLEVSKEIGFHEEQARLLTCLGRMSLEKGDFAESERWYREKLELAETRSDRTSIGESFHGLGHVAQSQGDFDLAVGMLEKSIEVFEELEDFGMQDIVHRCIGRIHRNNERIEDAIESFDRANEITERVSEMGVDRGQRTYICPLGESAEEHQKGDS